MTSAEAWLFNIALRPRKPEGSLGRTAQDGHFDSHTQLLNYDIIHNMYGYNYNYERAHKPLVPKVKRYIYHINDYVEITSVLSRCFNNVSSLLSPAT